MTSLPLFDLADVMPDADRVGLLSQWFTPPLLARKVAEWARLDGLDVLEPSAGGGALVRAAVECGARSVQTCEIDPRHAAAIAGCRLGSFLDARPSDFAPVDLALMNPPYEDGVDGDFLAHALEFAPRVVALIRLNALVGLGRYESVWRSSRITRIAFCVRRPPFESDLATGGAKSDFVVVEYAREDSRYSLCEQTIEHWPEAWS